MIYGILPVGGFATRLGICFPKEMLPLKNYDFYYPVVKHSVDYMEASGCEQIYFIHGNEHKLEIKNFFNKNNYHHLLNDNLNQAKIFSIFLKKTCLKKNDIILYGLPDTVYKKNLFKDCINIEGCVCGMYKITDDAVVGRIDKNTNKFIKTFKTKYTDDFCWGILKLDYKSLILFNNLLNTNEAMQVEELLNNIKTTFIYGDVMYDLGTWKSINNYWKSLNE